MIKHRGKNGYITINFTTISNYKEIHYECRKGGGGVDKETWGKKAREVKVVQQYGTLFIGHTTVDITWMQTLDGCIC